MTLSEACEVAKEVERNAAFVLVAIGRFVPVKDIKADTPWRVSVETPEGKPVVIWSLEQWRGMLPKDTGMLF